MVYCVFEYWMKKKYIENVGKERGRDLRRRRSKRRVRRILCIRIMDEEKDKESKIRKKVI